MALRIFGGVVAVLLASFVIFRYGRRQLRRGELFGALVLVAGLAVAALAPDLYDVILSPLGFKPGGERRIVGLLVLTNLLTLALVFRSFSREDLLSDEIGELVDYMALRRWEEEGQTPAFESCAVVMPAHNEADNLPAVLSEMPAELLELPVVPIVVADGCTDDTEATARELGALVIRRDLRRGSGAAVRLGYQVALRLGAQVVVTIDSDGQHDPAEMPTLVKPLLEGAADMVQGSRVLGSFEIESRARKHGVVFFSKLLSALSRTKITDPSNGYRAVTSDALLRLDLRQDQFYVSEMILEAARAGVRVVEVPITLRRRASGRTKKPTTARYAWGFTKAIARTWLRHPPGGKPLAPRPRWISNSKIEIGKPERREIRLDEGKDRSTRS
ncbi:MAG: glycosyltransferase family 2 protein [Actinomycetota bacterium]|nr:glycosyltransferase family 2 protein [Actinomycetota bacterium]